jgi:hypothetical protein
VTALRDGPICAARAGLRRASGLGPLPIAAAGFLEA